MEREGDELLVFRRNPIRQQEIDQQRKAKRHYIEKLIEWSNLYLEEPSRAKVEAQPKCIQASLKKLKIEKWLSIKEIGSRWLDLQKMPRKLAHASKLDGC
ncbi:MAG: hypothetical protein GKR87_02215 [Kiritimatiellae bacterium]|nr:hypothetical protein [Kiritimatiellia bacterium]